MKDARKLQEEALKAIVERRAGDKLSEDDERGIIEAILQGDLTHPVAKEAAKHAKNNGGCDKGACASGDCATNGERFVEGCESAGCRMTPLEVACAHQKFDGTVSKSGVLLLLLVVFTAVTSITAWSEARGYDALSFAAWGVVAALAARVGLSRSGMPSRIAPVQIAATFTLAGIAVFDPYNGSSVGVGAGVAALALVSLMLGMLRSTYGFPGMVRFGMLGGAFTLFLLGLMTIPIWATFSAILLLSAGSLLLGFFGGFVTPAAHRVFAMRLGGLPNWFNDHRPHKFDAKSVPDPARKVSGALGAFEIAAIQVVKASVRGYNAFRSALNAIVKSSFDALSLLEDRTRRVFVRMGQIGREIGRLAVEWAKQTWGLLDDRFHPSVTAVLLFLAAGMGFAFAARRLNGYVGSGLRFGPTAWADLAIIVLLCAGGTLAHLLACSTYGDDYPNAVRSVGNFALALVPYGLIVSDLTVLGTVVGLPVLSMLPLMNRFAMAGPYEFGPAGLIAVLGALAIGWLIARVLLGIEGQSNDPPDKQDGFDFGSLLPVLAKSLTVLEIERIAPAMATAIVGATIVMILPAALP